MTLKRLGQVRGEKRGVSAIEFALIAPVMIAMFFGAAESSLLLSADRKVTQTASTVTDLVAQTERLSESELTDIFVASRTVMEPFTGAPCMRVTSVIMPTPGSPQVEWTRANGCTGPGPAPGSAMAGVNDLLTVGGSVVVGEITYNYSSPISTFFSSNLTLSERFYLRPRRSAKVEIVP
jgi:Flp pilus assembly protein TadG